MSYPHFIIPDNIEALIDKPEYKLPDVAKMFGLREPTARKIFSNCAVKNHSGKLVLTKERLVRALTDMQKKQKLGGISFIARPSRLKP